MPKVTISISSAVVERVTVVPDPTSAAVVKPATPVGVNVMLVPIPVAPVVLPVPVEF